MALKITIKETEFGVGDRIRVVQKIKDGDKSREASFEGMVIGIRGRSPGKTFTIRKIADGGIGVERIFPTELPNIDRIVIVKKGMEGARRAKLYFTRYKSPTDIDLIYKRSVGKTKKSAENVKIKSASKKKK